ncbi:MULTISPECIES: acyl-CoA dehydrogenase family protein [Salipiger]|uniref:Probable acyl-CoA dehydrogenase n=1 Tax=Salipiger bermudensis (strain DSM 26914 / JCM 13377 / KCTC 12554 / HTCC2601) TaxID=314265 RepID=Q0FWC1_SALBH|nr:acyl-CoA dehydrogenase family protein [Salipiger bermudensis]EAU48631.1 probable acyl-CoA dehydrogenase [Salipiger bermudensis HTCC2601]MAE88714.1 acyl-CoA dehydrogenase [Pelagibaca sp.]MCA1283763.1 acyl-CoA/acyl-ACP dehydrogenase [Salipiger bermudensis]
MKTRDLPIGIEVTDERRQIVDNVKRICDRFDDEFWLEKENKHEFPHEFHAAMAEAGWLGITMPEEYGGANLGVTDAALLMQTIGNSAGAISACSTIHINLFGPHAMVKHGTKEQKDRMIPPLVDGTSKACFGVTEPDAGLDTTHISTRAVKQGANYIVHGQKVWTSTAQNADKILLLTRTTPIEDCNKPTDGMTLFYTDVDRDKIAITPIDKMGRNAVNSNAIFIDGLVIPEEDRIGEEGKGFKLLLDSLNPERILVAAEAIGVGRRALQKAAEYANERVVFGRPIGKNQSIQHPLAQSWMALEAADLMVWQAARLYDAGEPCGAEANAAKFLAADAAFEACDRAVRTHGGFGYAKEYHVERYFREIVLPRIAPVTREMIMSFIAERVLELPKSY